MEQLKVPGMQGSYYSLQSQHYDARSLLTGPKSLDLHVSCSFKIMYKDLSKFVVRSGSIRQLTTCNMNQFKAQ